MTTRLLLDTNLLVLLLVGSIRRDLVPTFRRTRAFSVEDFDKLLTLIPATARLVATPHVLAETSNLIGGLDGKTLSDIRELLGRLVDELDEEHVPATTVVANPLYRRLGITDAGISICAAARDLVVVTEDFDLYTGLERAGLDVINFNHYRLH